MNLTLPEINALPAVDFVSAFGPVFEHSPWIAERAAARRPFASLHALHTAMCGIVENADSGTQLDLIRAHPDLVGKIVLTAESKGEQAAAGLTDLSSEEVALFDRCNREYQARFGFPFVICARQKKKGRHSRGISASPAKLRGRRTDHRAR